MTLFMTSGSVEKRGTRVRLEVVRRLDTSGGAQTGSSRTKITRPPAARRG
jgi:hypothetical protein